MSELKIRYMAVGATKTVDYYTIIPMPAVLLDGMTLDIDDVSIVVEATRLTYYENEGFYYLVFRNRFSKAMDEELAHLSKRMKGTRWKAQ